MKRPRALRCAKFVSVGLLATFILVQIFGRIANQRPSHGHAQVTPKITTNLKFKDSSVEHQDDTNHLRNIKRVFKANKIDAVPPPVEAEADVKEVKILALNPEVKKGHRIKTTLQPSKGDEKVKNEDSQSNGSKKPSSSLSGERSHGIRSENPNSDKKEEKKSPENKEEILSRMEAINEQQFIKNEEIFGPVNNETVVIAIQIHNRLHYLRQLIVSLSTAKDIEKTLLIFSHDFWDPEINVLVSSIDFAKCMQIFYPFSIQTHPDEFPGESPNDCPRNTKPAEAKKINCTNQQWPDLYGHYREAKFTQTKHHWWWKANRIFDQLKATKEFNGTVLFLEEDHHVAEDFLHVLKMVNSERLAHHPDCDIISLGTYLKNLNYPKTNKAIPARNAIGFMGGGIAAALSNRELPGKEPATWIQLEQKRKFVGRIRHLLFSRPASVLTSVLNAFNQVLKTPWISSKHNMGMAFDRNLWNKFRDCSTVFCTFDDYNWDWSLHHLSSTCFKEPMKVLLVKAPRVFHVGECGVHHKKKDCESSLVVKKVQDILKQASPYLFPKDITLSVQPPTKKKKKLPKGNGGWGDLRDRVLCQNMVLTNGSNVEMRASLLVAQKYRGH